VTDSADSSHRVPIQPQSIAAPLSRSAIFLVLSIAPGSDALATAVGVIAGLDDLLKTVGFRDLNAHLSCNVAIGSAAWDRLDRPSRPSQLRPFSEVRGEPHTAVSTPGDLLFHIRSERDDFCFEFERLLLDAFGDSVSVEDETSGFRYFDSRDLLGFVDGTANPNGSALGDASLVGDEDPDFAGGSYVVVQKYRHDLAAWAALDTAVQEHIIGRRRIDNVELDDEDGGRLSHKSLATITDADGVEYDILRDNMPFGRPGHGEFGTYFIGYSRHLWVIERMLLRMFIGSPPGQYDRILDVSTAVTGSTFFAPPLSLLTRLGD
jgi:putative iron-dependent peroxidase